MLEAGTSRSESLAQLLSLDHQRLDALFSAAKQALRAGELARGAAQFAQFRAGLERHIAAEEELLFPAFEARAAAAQAGPTQVMRLEHAEIRALMAEIGAWLEHGGAGSTPAAAALTARLHAHNGKEERILYPAIERTTRDTNTLEALQLRLRVAP